VFRLAFHPFSLIFGQFCNIDPLSLLTCKRKDQHLSGLNNYSNSRINSIFQSEFLYWTYYIIMQKVRNLYFCFFFCLSLFFTWYSLSSFFILFPHGTSSLFIIGSYLVFLVDQFSFFPSLSLSFDYYRFQSLLLTISLLFSFPLSNLKF